MNERPKIKFKSPVKVMRPWTGADDATLRSMFLAGESADSVAATLDRTVQSVQHRAFILELSISRNLNLRAMRNRKHQRSDATDRQTDSPALEPSD